MVACSFILEKRLVLLSHLQAYLQLDFVDFSHIIMGWHLVETHLLVCTIGPEELILIGLH